MSPSMNIISPYGAPSTHVCVCKCSVKRKQTQTTHTQCQQMTTPLLLLFYGQLKFKKGRPLLPLSSSLSSYNVIITFCIGAQKQCGDAQSSFTFKCSKGGGRREYCTRCKWVDILCIRMCVAIAKTKTAVTAGRDFSPHRSIPSPFFSFLKWYTKGIVTHTARRSGSKKKKKKKKKKFFYVI